MAGISLGADTQAMRCMVMSMRLRRVFGPLFGGEPSIEFRPDGTVRVTVGECHAEFGAAAAQRLCGEGGAGLAIPADPGFPPGPVPSLATDKALADALASAGAQP